MTVIVRERHPLELAEHHLAYIDDHLLPDVGDEVGLPKVKNSAQEKDDDDADADGVQQSHVLIGEDVVDHVLDDPRDVEIRRRGKDDAHDRQHEFLYVRPHVGQQSLIVLHRSPTGYNISCVQERESSPPHGVLHGVHQGVLPRVKDVPSHRDDPRHPR